MRWWLLLCCPWGSACLAGTEGDVLSQIGEGPDAGSDASLDLDGGANVGGTLQIDSLIGYQYDTSFAASVLGRSPNLTKGIELQVDGVVIEPDTLVRGGPIANNFIWSLEEPGQVVVYGSLIQVTVTDATDATVTASARCDTRTPELICRWP